MAKKIKWSSGPRIRIQVNAVECIGTKLSTIDVLVRHGTSASIWTTG